MLGKICFPAPHSCKSKRIFAFPYFYNYWQCQVNTHFKSTDVGYQTKTQIQIKVKIQYIWKNHKGAIISCGCWILSFKASLHQPLMLWLAFPWHSWIMKILMSTRFFPSCFYWWYWWSVSLVGFSFVICRVAEVLRRHDGLPPTSLDYYFGKNISWYWQLNHLKIQRQDNLC